jgi:hypothetical protein
MGVRGGGAVRCAASLPGCTRVRDAVMRCNNCYATTTVSTSISLHVSPTTGVGCGALQGACCPRRAADPSAASCRRIQPVLNASRFNRLPPGPSDDSLANFEYRSMTASSGVGPLQANPGHTRRPRKAPAHGSLDFCSGDAFDDGAQVLARTRPSGISAVVVTSAAGVKGPGGEGRATGGGRREVGCRNVLTIGQRMF